MRYRECRWCHGRCDPGDLIDGICLECLEEEQQRIIRKRSVTQIMSSPCYQMEMQLEAMK